MRISPYIVLIWLACGPAVLTAQDNSGAGELFLKVFMLKTEAEKLEQAADAQGAIAKYSQAQQLIGTVAQNYPTFQPDVVAYRSRLIQSALGRLTRNNPVPATPTYAPAPSGSMVPQFAPAPQQMQQQPMAPNNGMMPQQPQQSGGIANPLDLINQTFEAQRKQIEEYKEKLRLYEDGYTNALRERQRDQQDIDLLRRQLQDITGKAEALAKQSSGKDAATKKEIEKAKAEEKMVKDMLANRTQQLMDTGKALEKQEGEKEALLAHVKGLEEELAKAKKDAIKPDDYNRVLAENTRLKGQLDDIQKQVETLKSDVSKKDVLLAQRDTEIVSLRTQITGIQEEVAKLRQENTAYQGQVAELTVKLKEVNAQLADSTSKPATPELAKATEENKALRNIIMRQLRQQQRHQQAKEIIMAEMKKMEITSQTLIENLEDITTGKMNITMDEEKLFSEPELKELFAADTGSYATLEAASTKKPADTRSETGKTTAAVPRSSSGAAEEKLMSQAVEAMRSQDYKAAEWAYEDALRANPRNVEALINLASIKLQNRVYDQSEVLLQKCLAYAPDNQLALHRLGVCYFQQGKLGEAVGSFEKSLVQDKKNALAHHYLGIITSRQGNRARAETEFKSALAIDPSYGDAHFNLAVLYATAHPPDWPQARKHYQSARDRGIQADPAMERILNETMVAPTPKLQSTASAR